MTLDESMKENDLLDEEHGVRILSEDNLVSYLEGAVVDYSEGGFQINTPATGGGCGGK